MIILYFYLSRRFNPGLLHCCIGTLSFFYVRILILFKTSFTTFYCCCISLPSHKRDRSISVCHKIQIDKNTEKWREQRQKELHNKGEETSREKDRKVKIVTKKRRRERRRGGGEKLWLTLEEASPCQII